MAIQDDVFRFTAWLALATGLLGMLSACVVALCFFAFPTLRSAWRRYVLFLSLCDFLQGLYYTLVGARVFEEGPACRATSLMGISSSTSSYLWTACISAYVTGFLVRQGPSSARHASPPHITALFCAISFGYPSAAIAALVAFSVPITPNRSSEDSYGCYIDDEEWGWRLVASYGPLWLCMLIVVACAVASLRQLNRLWLANFVPGQQTKQPNLVRLRRKILIVPLAFVLCRLPETIYRAIEYAGGGEWLRASLLGKVLNGVQAFSNPAQGLATSVLFVWSSPAYRRRLCLHSRSWLGRLCGCGERCRSDGAYAGIAIRRSSGGSSPRTSSSRSSSRSSRSNSRSSSSSSSSSHQRDSQYSAPFLSPPVTPPRRVSCTTLEEELAPERTMRGYPRIVLDTAEDTTSDTETGGASTATGTSGQGEVPSVQDVRGETIV